MAAPSAPPAVPRHRDPSAAPGCSGIRSWQGKGRNPSPHLARGDSFSPSAPSWIQDPFRERMRLMSLFAWLGDFKVNNFFVCLSYIKLQPSPPQSYLLCLGDSNSGAVSRARQPSSAARCLAGRETGELCPGIRRAGGVAGHLYLPLCC